MDNINQIDTNRNQPIGVWDGKWGDNHHYKGVFKLTEFGISAFTGYIYCNHSPLSYFYHATMKNGVMHGFTHLVNDDYRVELSLHFT